MRLRRGTRKPARRNESLRDCGVGFPPGAEAAPPPAPSRCRTLLVPLRPAGHEMGIRPTRNHTKTPHDAMPLDLRTMPMRHPKSSRRRAQPRLDLLADTCFQSRHAFSCRRAQPHRGLFADTCFQSRHAFSCLFVTPHGVSCLAARRSPKDGGEGFARSSKTKPQAKPATPIAARQSAAPPAFVFRAKRSQRANRSIATRGYAPKLTSSPRRLLVMRR